MLSSLFFHDLTSGDKRRTLAEVRRVLRPNGELHIADRGRSRGLVMRLLSQSIALRDGREQTSDSLAGRLPALLKDEGFVEVRSGARYRTAFGTLCLHSGTVAANTPLP